MELLWEKSEKTQSQTQARTLLKERNPAVGEERAHAQVVADERLDLAAARTRLERRVQREQLLVVEAAEQRERVARRVRALLPREHLREQTPSAPAEF